MELTREEVGAKLGVIRALLLGEGLSATEHDYVERCRRLARHTSLDQAVGVICGLTPIQGAERE